MTKYVTISSNFTKMGKHVSDLFTANIIKSTISTKNEIEIFNKLYAQKSRDSIAVEDTFAVSTYE